jgi:hypothetical protein
MRKDSGQPMPVLIYFDGCPNADEAKRRLRDADIDFVEERQDSLPKDHPHLNYSSPTLLLGEQVIFGAVTSAGGSGGCSLELPEAYEIRNRLKAMS